MHTQYDEFLTTVFDNFKTSFNSVIAKGEEYFIYLDLLLSLLLFCRLSLLAEVIDFCGII